MSTSTAPAPSWDDVNEIACLLYQAAEVIWDDADLAGARTPLHGLALGAYLAAARTIILLPRGINIAPLPPRIVDSPVELLRAADQLTHTFRFQGRTAGDLSSLIVAIGDLLREAQDLGY